MKYFFFLPIFFQPFKTAHNGGHGNPLQYSCLENPLDRGAWWATVHRIPKSRTRLKQLSMRARCGRTKFSSTMEESQYTMPKISKSRYSSRGYFLKCTQTVKKHMAGTSLAVQWLRLCAFKNEDSALLPF